MQLLSQGVDGIYMFNYACHLREHTWSKSKLNKLTAVLNEAGQIKTLKNIPRQYTFWEKLPVEFEHHEYPMGHEISQTELEHIRGWLDGVLSGA